MSPVHVVIYPHTRSSYQATYFDVSGRLRYSPDRPTPVTHLMSTFIVTVIFSAFNFHPVCLPGQYEDSGTCISFLSICTDCFSFYLLWIFSFHCKHGVFTVSVFDQIDSQPCSSFPMCLLLYGHANFFIAISLTLTLCCQTRSSRPTSAKICGMTVFISHLTATVLWVTISPTVWSVFGLQSKSLRICRSSVHNRRNEVNLELWNTEWTQEDTKGVKWEIFSDGRSFMVHKVMTMVGNFVAQWILAWLKQIMVHE